MGRFTVKAGTGYDTALPWAVRLLYLAASVDIKGRVLVFIEPGTRCVRGAFRHVLTPRRTVLLLEVRWYVSFFVDSFIKFDMLVLK